MKRLVQLKDYKKILNQYRGAYAQIWLFNVSLKRMILRLSFEDVAEVLFIISVSTEHIIGPTTWQKANIAIKKKKNKETTEVIYKVIDEKAGFELISESPITLVLSTAKGVDTFFEDI